jgi:hypothetical protein
MNVKALQKLLKFGFAGCHRNGTLASNSQPILRMIKSVIALLPPGRDSGPVRLDIDTVRCQAQCETLLQTRATPV